MNAKNRNAATSFFIIALALVFAAGICFGGQKPFTILNPARMQGFIVFDKIDEISHVIFIPENDDRLVHEIHFVRKNLNNGNVTIPLSPATAQKLAEEAAPFMRLASSAYKVEEVIQVTDEVLITINNQADQDAPTLTISIPSRSLEITYTDSKAYNLIRDLLTAEAVASTWFNDILPIIQSASEPANTEYDSNFPIADLQVDFMSGTSRSNVTGKITNDSDRYLQYAVFKISFFDDGGSLIGNAGFIIRGFGKGETATFEGTTHQDLKHWKTYESRLTDHR